MFEEPTREALVKRIVTYRSQNELEPIEHLNMVLENYWCSLPENCGACEENKTLSRSMLSYLRGGISLVKNIYYGDKNMVDEATADKRSTICAECPFNIFPDKGAFLKWSDDIAEGSTGGKRSINHELLGNCEICTCPLKAKVWYKAPDGRYMTDKELAKAPSYCWQRNKA